MPDPSPKELQPYRRVQASTERQLQTILEQTARSIRKRINSLPVGVGGQVRAAQLTTTLAAIKKLQSYMWTGNIQPAVSRGIKDAEDAAETAVEMMTRVAYAALSDAAAEALTRGLKAAAESGLKSDAARKVRELSSRVYRQRALHEGKVEQLIREGLIANLSAKELASSVYKYVSPTTPGGASYAAMRLARTEVNNAFHERQLMGAERPGVKAVKWNLSGSHKVPDLCNEYASHGGNGQWAVGKVPDKPHPQCFCYLTYITQSSEEFQKALADGDFDAEIDRRTRENLARLGQPVGNTMPPTITKREPLVSDVALSSVPKSLTARGHFTRPQRKALKQYESADFVLINGFLRRGSKVEDKFDVATQKVVDNIDSAMDASVLTNPVRTWRGMNRSSKLFGDRFNNDLTGFAWEEQAYSSTSTEESVAKQFAILDFREAVIMNIVVPKGTKAIKISDSFGGNQAEIMLQRGTTWKVVKDNGVDPDGYRRLDVEVTT